MGNLAMARWVHEQVNLQPTSHRAFFRRRLNPRSVESYQYGVPGPRACEKNARFRRFAFTYKDVELSRGSTNQAGGTGLPFTPMEIETIKVRGNDHYGIKFGDHYRTILSSPLQYEDDDGAIVALDDGKYTICSAEEVVGTRIGDNDYDYNFQVLVGDLCTSSFTDRGGIEDGKGDGSLDFENHRVDGILVRSADSIACTRKCTDTSKVKYIVGGHPEVTIPEGFNLSGISWVDLSELSVGTDIVNINTDRTHDSNWLLRRDLATCKDENDDDVPDPAGLANTDYFSYGRGK